MTEIEQRILRLGTIISAWLGLSALLAAMMFRFGYVPRGFAGGKWYVWMAVLFCVSAALWAGGISALLNYYQMRSAPNLRRLVLSVTLLTTTIGLGILSARLSDYQRAIHALPEDSLPRLDGRLTLKANGEIIASLHNESTYTVESVVVEIMVFPRDTENLDTTREVRRSPSKEDTVKPPPGFQLEVAPTIEWDDSTKNKRNLGPGG